MQKLKADMNQRRSFSNEMRFSLIVIMNFLNLVTSPQASSCEPLNGCCYYFPLGIDLGASFSLFLINCCDCSSLNCTRKLFISFGLMTIFIITQRCFYLYSFED